MSKYFTVGVVFFAVCSSGSLKQNNFENQPNDGNTSPSGKLIRETLRQVFGIPEDDHKILKLSRKPLRFMLRMYERLLEGQSSLPPHANTVRSVMPLDKDSAVMRSYGGDNFLVYNVSTSHQERLLASYLHMMGHRRGPNRDSRLLFYLDGANETERSERPMMVAFMKKLPMDVEITRLVRKTFEERPNHFLRVEVEHLRRGNWVKSSSKRPLSKTPILIVISADAQMPDLEAFGVGALSLQKSVRVSIPAESNKEDEEDDENVEDKFTEQLLQEVENDLAHNSEIRTKRSMKTSYDIIGDELYDENISIKPLNENSYDAKKDKYYIQKQALLSTIKAEAQDVKYLNPNVFSQHDESSFQTKGFENMENHLHSEDSSPFATNTVSLVNITPDSNNNRKLSEHFQDVKETIEKNITKSVTQSFPSVDNNISPTTKKKKKKTKQARKKNDPNLLPPLTEYRRPLPKREPNRISKQKSSSGDGGLIPFPDNGGLIPFPDNYVSWDKWENPRGGKWRRRFRRGNKRNKNKNGKSKKLPSHWLQGSKSRLSKDGALSPAPSPQGPTCDRHEFYVDFKQLKWNKFIIAPEGFQTFFCAGACPSPLSQVDAGTNHAILQSLLRASGFFGKLPASCCVPAKFDSLPILLVDQEDRVVLRTFSNMVVKTCSCQ